MDGQFPASLSYIRSCGVKRDKGKSERAVISGWQEI